MRRTTIARVVALLALACPACGGEEPGAGSEIHGPERAGADAAECTAGAEMQDFGEWLGAQCPDGAVVALEDPATGEIVKALPCEQLRQKVLDDPSARAQLVNAYQTQPDTSQQRDPGERVSEATEPLLFGGLLCGLMAAAPGLIFAWPLHGCQRNTAPQANKQACEDWIGGSSAALAALCALGVFF